MRTGAGREEALKNADEEIKIPKLNPVPGYKGTKATSGTISMTMFILS